MYGEKREKFEVPIKKVGEELVQILREYGLKIHDVRPQPGNVIIRDKEGKIINNIDISSIRDLP